MYALVLPEMGDAAVDCLYTYLIPARLAGQVSVGMRVAMPLGNRVVSGFVFALEDETEVPPEKLKPLLSVKSPTPAFTPEQARLALWLADTYLCPISEAVRPCLVEAGAAGGRRCWQVADEPGVTTLLADPEESAVLDYLRANPGASSAGVRASCGDAGMAALESLRHAGMVRPAAGKVKNKAREVALVIPAVTCAELLTTAEAVPAKQAELLRWLAAYPEEELTTAELARRSGVGTSTINTCIKKELLKLETRALRRNPWDTVEGRKAEAPQLTPAQLAAGVAIEDAVQGREARSFLLFGVTGSGKTEVFLHAIARALAGGRQAIVLVPEISLTAQAMALYHGRFPHQVAVLHSHLSAGERYDEWMRIARGEARVILGARSAIFAPCDNVGLIVIDEEHESSYKQESSPRYHARTVAMERGRQHGAPVILASATPSLESMREAETGIHTLLQLPARIGARPMPPVRLVDLRKMAKGAHILSAPLRDAISARLAAGEQTILFLNRRGWSYALLCSKCGHQEMCPNCNLTLTYHKASGVLRCHHCDHLLRAQAECPTCKGPVIAFKGVGTERLQEEVRTAWPAARLGRMDRDSTVRKGAHQEILDKFDRRETDILIGTQMVAKGLDFPRVTLVGVIAADTSLAIPDFRAPERTFQLLTQVAGRAGRAEWAGEVFVQTFQPFHYAIEAAAKQDYALFYAQELLARAEAAACWPPLTALINVLVIGEKEDEVAATAAALARRAREEGAAENLLPPMDMTPLLPHLFEQLQVEVPVEEETDPFGITEVIARAIPPPVSVDGPTACSLPRLRGEYRYHLVLRGQDRPALRAVARALRSIEPPKSVRVIIDVDPLSLG